MTGEPDVALDRVEGAGMEWALDLLDGADLPTEDLRGGGAGPTLYAVEVDGDRVGCIGIERYGDAALLRSAAVAEPYRGEGYGRGAVRALESHARDDGVAALYLLTTTAAAFFAELGYERIEREAVPDAVRESAEFDDLCPVSATVMSRPL